MPGSRVDNPLDECWAVDLGTTNTVVARCRGMEASPVHLGDVCIEEPIEHTPMIPSQLFFDAPDRWHVGALVPAALELERDIHLGRLTPVARSWKRALGREATKPVAQCGGRLITARQCAAAFLRTVVGLAGDEAQRLSGRTAASEGFFARLLRLFRRPEPPIRDLVITAPVESFDSYRAELHCIARDLGVRRFRTLDEPVAAALGYGVDLGAPKTLLIVDFGGGTLDIAVVEVGLEPVAGTAGYRRARVYAAGGIDIGGETVDEWLTDLACDQAGGVPDMVRGMLRAKAEAVKIELSAAALSTDCAEFRVAGISPVRITRGQFEGMLRAKRLYDRVSELTDKVLDEAAVANAPGVEETLLVGGSTQLPGVAEILQTRMGRDKVRAWSPFRSVAVGAALFGAGRSVDQIIHHDYAVRLFDHGARRPEYELLVSRGSRYPARAGETRYYTLQNGQTELTLAICEVGLAGRRRVNWQERASGHRYWTPTAIEERECVYVLNEGDAIPIRPPGVAGRTRLRVDFTVDDDRYLCATVHDLQLKRDLRTAERVVRMR